MNRNGTCQEQMKVIEPLAYGRYSIILADPRIAILNPGINPAKPGTVSFFRRKTGMVSQYFHLAGLIIENRFL